MKTPRVKITILYRVLDEKTNALLEVVKEIGTNKNNIQWRVERRMVKKYKKPVTLKQMKVVEEET